MKTLLTVLGIIIAILFVLVGMPAMYGIAQYNSLVTLNQSVDKHWGDVQSVYQRRMDLIPNLVNTVQAGAKFEKDTFTQVAQARASVGQLKIDASQAPKTAEQLQQFQAAQGQLGSALSRLMMVTENYPELKAGQGFRDLQAQLEGTENRISVERRNFNGAVEAYNNQCKRFPVVFFAAAMGYSPRPYFAADAAAATAPTVKFN